MRRSSKRHRVGMMTSIAIVALAVTAGLSMAAETVRYTYDELGRISMATYPDGKQILYVYDATGNRTQQVIRNNPPPDAVNDINGGIVDTNISMYVDFDPRINDSDPNGDPFTITAKTNGAYGTVTITGGGTSVRYTASNAPSPGQTVPDSYTYTITDSYGAVDTATVQVAITTPEGPCVPPPGEEFCEVE
jgi:YD repeat-containing protein/VCBS repeat-containing protein